MMNDELLGVARNMSEMMLTVRRTTIYLPEDLVVEILSRVPLASLARLRWTSKEWNALIKDKILAEKPSQVIMLIDARVYLVSINLHEINKNDEVKLINQFSLKDPLSSKEVNIRNVFHCDGLLLCSTEDNRIVVWNPCSRETRWIQPRSSCKKFGFYALGKTSCSKYKILRVDQFDVVSPVLLEFEIYDFTSNSWRVFGESIDPFIVQWKSHGMSVNGNTYWLAFSQNNYNDDFVLSFDFTRERFGRESLPGDHLSYHFLSLSVTREDQLCLLATLGLHVFDFDVWIATKIASNGVMSWSKFLSVNLDPIPQLFCYNNSWMNFLVDKEKKVLVSRGLVSNNFLHVVGENKCIQVDTVDAKSTCSLFLSYVPSFVQIQPEECTRASDI